MHTRHCASVLVNMVSPDSPISPNMSGNYDSHFADEERGSQRIGNSAGSGRTAMATQLGWPPKTMLFMLPQSSMLSIPQTPAG